MNENGNKKKQVNDDVNSAVSFPSIFTEIIKNLLSFFNRVTVSEYYWDWVTFTGFYWVLLGFTGFLLGFTGFLLGFYWVLLGSVGFTRF